MLESAVCLKDPQRKRRKQWKFDYESLKIDTNKHKVYIADKKISLTSKEFKFSNIFYQKLTKFRQEIIFLKRFGVMTRTSRQEQSIRMSKD